MGRNARRRAAVKEAHHAQGAEPDADAERKPPARCPRCGSTNIVITPSQSYGVPRFTNSSLVDIICGNCNWQGEMNAGVW